VFNQKGGIGKTTTSVNLAICLAAAGYRVGLIDVDSQSNAASSLGQHTERAPGSYHLLKGSITLAEALQPSLYPGLTVCRADDELAGLDLELALEPEPHALLRRSLARGELPVDVIVIDCPPALGVLPINALAASTLTVMPVCPEPMAHDGLQRAWRHIHRLRAKLNPGLEIVGILPTMVRDDAQHAGLTATLRQEFGDRVLPVDIPVDVAALQASHNDIPVCVFAPESRISCAYLTLAELVAARIPGGGVGFDRRLAEAALRDWHQTVLLAPPPPVAAPPAPSVSWLASDAESSPSREDDAAQDERLASGQDLSWLAGAVGALAGALGGFGLVVAAHLAGWLS
jgi:chromosome partitioning protein